MKKLIILLLFPLVSFSQTYEDIISIDSKEQFIRIGIENDYEVIKNNNDEVEMGKDPRIDKNGAIFAKGLAYFNIRDGFTQTTFQFQKKTYLEKHKYDMIFSFVKNNLKFEKIMADASFYIVDENRKIGFGIDNEWCVVIFYNR